MASNLRCAVISLGSISSQMVVDALKKYFDVVDNINLKDIEFSVSGDEKTALLYCGKQLPHYDCIYIKGSFRYAMLLRSITQFLWEEKTYIPVQAEAFIIVNDKLLTHLELEKVKIPMPKTYVVATVESAKTILHKIKFPIIIKIPQGTHGKGVMVVDSIPAAKGLLDTLNTLNQPFLLQEFIECNGEDIRCFVVGDKVVASMKRKSAAEDVRSNLHSGGVAESYDVSQKMKDIAIKSAKQLGCDICGVDILETPKGGVVIEANVSPGMQGITKASGVSVAEEVAKYLYEQTVKKLNKQKDKDKKILGEEIGTISTPKTTSQQSIISEEIITKLDIHAGKITLPEIITKLSGFSSESEYAIKTTKEKIEVRKL
jgi:ribosomal protein S6--L-glutamate ligase